MCSFALLDGDESGRVNILLLLFLFVVVPVIGIVLSAVSLVGKEISAYQRSLESLLFLGNKLSGHNYTPEVKRLMLIYHGQYGGVGWAMGSIFALIILLLFTDINFVWRSTLLTPESLLPLLNWIAFPWFFWEAAQPSISLLSDTQDSRLLTSQQPSIAFSQWWPFILACQLFYAFISRSLAMFVISLKIKGQLRSVTQNPTQSLNKTKKQTVPLSKKITHQLPDNFDVINWAGFDTDIIQQLSPDISNKRIHMAGPLAANNATSALEKSKNQLILVKAWEPPLAELSDHLQEHHGLLAPVEVISGQANPPKEKHLEEWNRFIADLPNWSLYVTEETAE